MAVTPLERYHYRKTRVRKKVSGTSERPRLTIYRSLKHVYAQVVDDTQGKTIAFASSLEGDAKSGGNVESAKKVGKLIAEKLTQAKVKKVVFDRGGRIYHGVIKALAESARENGLEF